MKSKEASETELTELEVAPLLTLSQLAIKYGQLAPSAPDGCEFKSAHAAAAVMHRWRQYEYNYGPLRLTEHDYLAALDAALHNSVHAAAVAPK